MKKFFIIILIICLLSTPVLAQEEWILNSEEASFQIKISSSAEVKGNAKDIKADLKLYPREENDQNIIEIDSFPESEQNFIFEWAEAEDEVLEIEINSKVKTKQNRPLIKEKISFPIRSGENNEYLSSSPSIDINNREIQRLAEELASGEDDLYKFTNKVAAYVEENIEYSLDSITEKSSKPASWVLENKRGVCDELTNLFIALMRAGGVPARFVSGLAYTDSDLFENPWGPHGWAEVYFPNHGWVPVDVTYKQVGWTDLSHIKLNHGLDPAEPSISYNWKGDEIIPSEINFEATPLDQKGKVDRKIQINADPVNERIGFGSFNQLEVEVKNLKDYYLPASIHITKSNSIELLDKPYKLIILEPKEIKKIYFPFKVKEGLDPGYKYTSYIKAEALGSESTGEVSSTKDYLMIEESEREEEKKEINPDQISLRCEKNMETAYLEDQITLKCKIINKIQKNIFLNFCIFDCEQIELKPSQHLEIEKEIRLEKPGKQDLRISLSNKDIYKIESLEIDVLAKPSVKFSPEYDKKLEYKDTAKISFTLTEINEEIGKANIIIKLNGEIIQEENLGDLQIQRFNLNIPAQNLRAGPNVISVEMRYEDRINNEYYQKENIDLMLVNLSFWERINIWLRQTLR